MNSMHHKTLIKRIKLSAITLIAAFLCSYLPFQQTSASQEPAERKTELVATGVPLAERLGADDGAAFVIHFGGDTHGELGTCG